MEGWVKLHRELLDKPIWVSSTPEQKSILITLLLMANHEEKKWEWKGEKFVCKPGQFVTSLEGIRIIAGKGVSTQNIRSALLRFEKLKFLTNESTMLNRLITICNWVDYQSDQQCDQHSNQQRTNKALTTNKNDKNNIILLTSNEVSAEIENPETSIPHEKSEKVFKIEKPKKPRKKKEKPETENTLHSRAREVFEARYHRETGERYYWSAKDAGNMNNLLNALKYQREQKGLSNTDDTDVLAAFSAFVNSAVKDEWIKKNLSIPVLFSKFNEIVARAKEEQQRRNGTHQHGSNTDEGRKPKYGQL